MLLLNHLPLDDRVQRAMTLFNPKSDLSHKVSDIARCVGLSGSQLSRLFRKEVGAAPAAVRKSICLEEAERRLLTTRLSVKEIAHRAGFHYVSNFVKDFEAAYGLSPARYRRAMSSPGESGSGESEYERGNLLIK